MSVVGQVVNRRWDMRIGRHIDIDEAALAVICHRFGVAELSIFGSILRDDFAEASDVDVLYVLDDDADIGWAIVDLQEELSGLFGHPVDLVSKRFLRPRFAARVIPSAERIFGYAA